ncbi:LacI family DNA-binding transcriptional regulator [Collinsella tanakaei]|uniref:substrate-binding domain-containing protein n=1 Tax=Collinsella tanakaei TaxID=626935 RepID=UPI00195E0E3A|nr:LacI family DNA-binding transcriptional regulator [Collinsella tanakaei]MBM6754937.1 LacI family DNA-binding transcriptional regulator [Collinsella tanakaei]
MPRKQEHATGTAVSAPSGGRVTMKDIASALGVSVNTVHKAIAGKPGVSEKVRAKILAYAEENGYRRNESASSLRRKDAQILVCLPSAEGSGRYYYSYVWEGCHRYMAEARDTGMHFSCHDYVMGNYLPSLEDVVRRVEAGKRYDGMLALAPSSAAEAHALRALTDAGVVVELINGDDPSTGRFGSVVADYAAAGHLMAEQACNLVRGEEGPVRMLLLSGDPYIDSHYLVARAFHEYIRENAPMVRVEDLTGAHARADELRRELVDHLTHDELLVACSVFAAGSEVLGDALVEAGRVGKVAAIGSDLFPESVLALRRGIFTNVVYKDPTGIAYRAMKTLGEHVLWGMKPARDVEVFPVELVFRSNLDHYCEEAGAQEAARD